MKQLNKFSNIISIIKEAINKNQKQISFLKGHYNYKVILMQLQKKGFIRNFEESGNYILIRLKQPKVMGLKEVKKSFIYFTILSRYKKPSMKNKDILYFNKIQGESTLTIYNTDQGIKNFENVSKLKIGGVPLLKIV